MYLRVPDFLSEHDVAHETMVHPPAYTSTRLARYLHTPGKQVVKSVLLSSGRGYYLAVLPATMHIDLTTLSDRLETNVRLANEDEMADIFRDCERGAATPFGSLYGIRTLLEGSISPEDCILFEAQWHAVAVRMRCADFEKVEKPRRLAFAVTKAPVSCEGSPFARTHRDSSAY